MAGTLVEFFDNPSKWTQKDLAKNAKGVGTHSHSSDAVCFCLYGAVNVVYASNERARVLMALMDTLMAITGDDRLAAWNDDPERTFEDIVDLCKKAGV